MTSQEDTVSTLFSGVQSNEGGWGPQGVPDMFKDLPYQVFNKSDKIGKVCDWTGTADTYRRYNRYQQYTGGQQAGTQYSYYHDGEDSQFQLVDTSRPMKTMMQRSNKLRLQQQQKKLLVRERERKTAAGYAPAYRGRGGFQRGGARGGRGGYQRQPGRYDAARNKTRQPSAQVDGTWEVLDEIDFSKLTKVRAPNAGEGEDIKGHSYGALRFYDTSYNRINPKRERPLEMCQDSVARYKVSTSDDPVLLKLAGEKEGNVFGTDIILAALMCCTRSVYSWDVIVERVGDMVFFDKRDIKGDAQFVNAVDALTVSETSNNPPTDEGTGGKVNSPSDLGKEAEYVNENFRMQVMKRDGVHKMENEELPFHDDDDDEEGEGDAGMPSCIAYKYRKFNLGRIPGTQIDAIVVARTEHDAVVRREDGGIDFVTMKAFLELNSANETSWRQKLENQKGAMLASEMKNNSYKLAKWTLQAVMAKSDILKFGYVSRVNQRESTKHAVLSTIQYKPQQFLSNISLDMTNAWGILREIVGIVLAKPQGTYLLMKDPEKPALRLYSVPKGTFDDKEDDDEESTSSEVSDATDADDENTKDEAENTK